MGRVIQEHEQEILKSTCGQIRAHGEEQNSRGGKEKVLS